MRRLIAWILMGIALGMAILAGLNLAHPKSIVPPALPSSALEAVPLPIPTHTAAWTTTRLFPATTTAYAVDSATMTPLYAQNETTPRPIASLTKMMTLLIVLSDHKPSDSVTVAKLPTYDPADVTLGLVQGQVFSVNDLAKAALIDSDNDAADALAIYDAGSETAFIKKMNAKLAEWGIPEAHFNSATGLTDENNLVSAVALTKIAKLALTNPVIAGLISEPTATISDKAGKRYNLRTTNDLLATGQFYGIKTGYTDAAGQCFVGLAHVNGHAIITVVLGSNDRFGNTMQLFNWIQGAWQWQ